MAVDIIKIIKTLAIYSTALLIGVPLGLGIGFVLVKSLLAIGIQ